MTAVNNGYYRGRFAGEMLSAHRVVWFLVHGWSPEVVDHIDGNRLNNRVENLRASTYAENAQNKLCRGTTYNQRDKRWRAQIGQAGQVQYLGSFATEEEAHMAYLIAKQKQHPHAGARCFT